MGENFKQQGQQKHKQRSLSGTGSKSYQIDKNIFWLFD